MMSLGSNVLWMISDVLMLYTSLRTHLAAMLPISAIGFLIVVNVG